MPEQFGIEEDEALFSTDDVYGTQISAATHKDQDENIIVGVTRGIAGTGKAVGETDEQVAEGERRAKLAGHQGGEASEDAASVSPASGTGPESVTPEKPGEAQAFLKKMFTVAGNEYHFKDQSDPKLSLAFVDRDKTLATKHNDPQVVAGMLKLAEVKGWSKLEAKGSDEFRREVWVQGVAHGYEVSGYKPTAIDIQRARQEREKLEKNIVSGAVENKVQGGQSKPETANVRTDVEIAEYAKSAGFTKVMERAVSALEKGGYPVDDKFVKSIHASIIKDYAQGREVMIAPEQERERATPVQRGVGPAHTFQTDTRVAPAFGEFAHAGPER